jgi:hypothetical protein
MYSKLLVLLFICGFVYTATSQDKFHRIYPLEENNDVQCIDAIQMIGGDYVGFELKMSKKSNGDIYSDTLILTSYKPKGDMSWTRAIKIDSLFIGFSPVSGSIIQGANDSLYFSIATTAPNKPNKLIGSASKAGNLGWFRVYATTAGISDGTVGGHFLSNFNNTFFSSYTVNKNLLTKAAISRKNYSGTNIWSKSLTPTNRKLTSVSDITTLTNSHMVMSGVSDSSFFLTVLDSAGVVKWSKNYTQTLTKPRFHNAKVVGLKDTSFVMAVNNEAKRTSDVIKLNKAGNTVWVKTLKFTGIDSTLITDIALDKQERIMVAGVAFVRADSSYNFQLKIDALGQIVWKKKFPRVKAKFNHLGSLFGTTDKGSVFINSVVQDGITVSSFIKLDEDGSSSCESDIMETVLVDNTYKSDTLVWTSVNEGVTDTITRKVFPNKYNIPFAELKTKKYCPNEPIVHDFIVPIAGATNYKWSTGLEGPKADSLRVFDDAEYSITVTVNEGVCFILCNSAKNERYTKPQAILGTSIGNFCTNNKITLTAGYLPGHPSIKSVTWSTGEVGVNSIEIAQSGNYSVTIVDQCDEVATATSTSQVFPKKITEAKIAANTAVDCLKGLVTGTLVASSDASGLGDDRYQWSTGEKSKTISLNDAVVRTFTVTVTDGCGNTKTAMHTVELKGAGISSVAVQPNSARLCKEKIIDLNAVANKDGDFTYAWSNGEKTPKIGTLDPGTYTITVTDKCGNTASGQRDIKKLDFDILPLLSDVNLISNINSDCSGINVGFTFEPNNDLTLLKSFLWSTGETARGIKFTGAGNYALTVTDNCDTEYKLAKDFELPEFISYAHVFFPDGINATISDSLAKVQHELNRTFGPIRRSNSCYDQITSYEFYIFNRWGQQVFESKDIIDEWDPRREDKHSPSDTYVWMVKYSIFGFTRTQKGDVTLIR